MTRTTRSLGALVACVLCATGLTLDAWAEEPAQPGPAAVAPPPAADAPQIEHFEYWQGRAAVARAHVAATRERLDAANTAVNRMQRRNHPRGTAREELRREQTEARAAGEAAVHVLDVELPAEARAAGADPRWLRERS